MCDDLQGPVETQTLDDLGVSFVNGDRARRTSGMYGFGAASPGPSGRHTPTSYGFGDTGRESPQVSLRAESPFLGFGAMSPMAMVDEARRRESINHADADAANFFGSAAAAPQRQSKKITKLGGSEDQFDQADQLGMEFGRAARRQRYACRVLRAVAGCRAGSATPLAGARSPLVCVPWCVLPASGRHRRASACAPLTVRVRVLR